MVPNCAPIPTISLGASLSHKPVFPLLNGLDYDAYVLGVSEDFDDLRLAEIEEAERILVRQPTTRRTDGHGPVGETG